MRKIFTALAVLSVLALLFGLVGCSAPAPTSSASSYVPVSPLKTQTLSVSPDSADAFDAELDRLLDQAKGFDQTEILLPAGSFTVEQNHTVPANVTLTLARGCVFNLNAQATLTIYGTVNAAATYIFQGEGTVVGDIQGKAYVQWFGADQSEISDTVCFQKAIDCCRYVIVPNRNKAYSITHLRIEKPVTLSGSGANRVMLSVPNELEGHTVSIASDDVRLENFTFTYANKTVPTEFSTIFLDTSSRNLQDISVYNVQISYCNTAVSDAKSDQYTVKNLTLDHMKIGANRSNGIHLTDCTTGILLNDVTVSSFDPNIITCGFVFENVQQMHLENVDNLGGFTKKGEGSGDGMVFRNCKNVTSYRIMIDYVHGRQLVIENCSNFRLSNYVTSLLNAEGIYIDGLTDSVLDVFKANGSYPASGPAVYLKRCNGVTFNDLIVTYAGNEGVVLEECSNNIFNNLVTSASSDPYALREESNCSNNVFNAVVLSDSYTLQGQGSVIYALRTNKSELIAQVHAPAQG